MTARTPGKRKRRTIVEEDITDNEVLGGDQTNDFDVSLEGVEDTETLNQVLEQFGQTNNVLYRIYRQTPTGPPSFCYESTSFDEQFLQRARGAGTYTVRIFINGKFKRSITVQVDAPDPAADSNGHTNGNGTGHTAFLEKMLMALILKEHTPQPGMNLKDMTEALANLDGLRGKQESTMDIFLKGAQFFKDMNNGGGEPVDWKTEMLKMGREALPAITSVIQARAGMPVNPQEPNGGPVTPPVQQIDPNNLTVEQRNALLKQGIAFLKQQFLMGLDAESALSFIVANAGNPQYSPLIRALLSMQWEELEALDNDLKIGQSFHTQFRTLFDGLRYEFSPENSVEDDTGRDTRDNADVGNHGDTRTGGKS